jgi:hypothetical protein
MGIKTHSFMATSKMLEKSKKKYLQQRNLPKNIEKCSSSFSIVVEQVFFQFFGGLEWVPLLCICRSLIIFERRLDWNPEGCRSKQARCQLSHPSPYLATHLPTLPPISLLSHPSPYLDTHLQNFQQITFSLVLKLT